MKLKYHIPLLFLIFGIVFFFIVLLYIQLDVRDSITSDLSTNNERFIEKHEDIAEEVGKLYPDQQKMTTYLKNLGEREQLTIKLTNPAFEQILFEYDNIEKEISTGDRWLPVKSPNTNEVVLFMSIERKLDEINEAIFQVAIDIFIFVVLTHLTLFILLTLYFHETITNPITNLINRFKMVSLHKQLPTVHPTRKDEIGELYHRFYELEARLQRAYREQIDMVSSIAHDLKTPLTSINGFLQLAVSPLHQTVSQKEEYIKLAQKKALYMTELVHEFSIFSTNEIALQEMDRFDVLIGKFFESIGEEYEAELAGLDYSFHWDHDFHDDTYFLGNEKFLRRLFANIISNSIKHAYNNDLKITMKGTIEESLIVINIEDNGVGVDEGDIPYLFQKFYTVEKSRQREKGGTGLGLAIAKSIVENHDGFISAYRSKGLGGLGIKIKLPISRFHQ
ncbi:sensor histidine kinase [Cytobacillus sp. Hm23]